MKLYELQKGMKIKFNNDDMYPNSKLENGDILEFLGVDGYYCMWKKGDEIILMGGAYQDVDIYGEIIIPLLDNKNTDDSTKEDNN